MAETDTTPAEESASQSGMPTQPGSPPAPRRATPMRQNQAAELLTEQGKTSIADSVVAKVAGVATREISGVHNMGKGVARTFGAIRERMPIGSDSPSPAQGVSVEVGERQAAIDLDVVVDYGVSIVDVAQAVRTNVIERVEGMTGLEVTEVNVLVDDVWLGEDEPEEPRVQ
jgi:uncharacterized alkaline shock family protein YloU